MPTHELKRFPGLPIDDQLYILDCIGGLLPNPRDPDNPLLECYFTPLRPETDCTTVPLKRDYSKQICAYFAVGYLPALFSGQAFKNKRALPSALWPEFKKVTLQLNSELTQSTTLGELKLNHPMTGPAYLERGKGVRYTTAECDVITEGSPDVPPKKSKKKVVFSDYELIRFYLTNSGFSCRKIFSGAFQNERLTVDVIYINHEPLDFDEVTRAGRFVYRIGYSSNDVPSLGRVLFDSSGYALQAAQQVHKSITADRINHVGGLAYPSTFFPFKATTNLSVEGRWMPCIDATGNKGYVFLVHQILRCSGPFPFSSLSYCCEVAPGGPPAPDDAQFAFAHNNTRDRGPAHDSAEVGFSQSDERPNAASEVLDILVNERQFDDLVPENIVKEKRTPSTHRSRPKAPQYLWDLINASTGAGTTGKSTAARQRIHADNFAPPPATPVVPAPVSVNLDSFMESLNYMRQKQTAWSIKTMHLGAPEDTQFNPETGFNFSLFPIVNCPHKTTLKRKFCFTDDEKKIRKRLACVAVKIGERHFYILEAERRLSTTGEAFNMLPTLFLHDTTFAEKCAADFIEILIDTVSGGTWPRQEKLQGFIRDHTKHGAWRPAVIADRLIETLVSINQ